MIKMSGNEPNFPTVAVVIPAFNEEEKIARALKSVKDQTIPPDEIIVVDHASTDRTVEIARSYTDQVYHIPAEQKLGAVRNRGIEESSSEIIYNTDADVRFSENVIEDTKRKFMNGRINALSHAILPYEDEQPIAKMILAAGSKLRKTGWGASLAVKKSVWENIQFENAGGDRLPIQPEDVPFWTKIPQPKIISDDAHVYAELGGFKSSMLPAVAISTGIGFTAAAVGRYIETEEEDF